MAHTICSARLADQQTRCPKFARKDSSLCTAHVRERDRSVREYKLVGERAEDLQPQAILTQASLKSIQPAQADAARKATEIYLDAVKEEARLRVAHTNRFYADGPIDGHHRRVQVLLEKVENGMRFVEQLRDYSRGIGQTNAAEPRPRVEQPRKREEPDQRLYSQPRVWQSLQGPPSQPYYSYSAPSSSGGRGSQGPSITVVFFKLAACYFAYRLVRALLAVLWGGGRRSKVTGTDTSIAFTQWAASQVASVQSHLSNLWQSKFKQSTIESAAALSGVREWMLSTLEAVGSSVAQLALSSAEPQGSQQGALVDEARKAAESAMDGAQKLAQRAAGEAQKLAANAVADVGKLVQEGLPGTDEVKQLAKSLGIRW